MAKLVARLLATVAFWVRIQISLKNTEMGDIRKRVANTQPAKKLIRGISILHASLQLDFLKRPL